MPPLVPIDEAAQPQAPPPPTPAAPLPPPTPASSSIDEILRQIAEEREMQRIAQRRMDLLTDLLQQQQKKE